MENTVCQPNIISHLQHVCALFLGVRQPHPVRRPLRQGGGQEGGALQRRLLRSGAGVHYDVAGGGAGGGQDDRRVGIGRGGLGGEGGGRAVVELDGEMFIIHTNFRW